MLSPLASAQARGVADAMAAAQFGPSALKAGCRRGAAALRPRERHAAQSVVHQQLSALHDLIRPMSHMGHERPISRCNGMSVLPR